MKQENYQTATLRIELQKEFVRRRKSNPSYSLRAYAKALDLDQSFLSKIMNGQRSITSAVAAKVVPKLRSKSNSISLLNAYYPLVNIDYLQMAEDEVSVLSEWSHFAILELIKTKDFKASAKWIAERLGLHVQEAQDALERLERMRFIKIEKSKIKLLKPNNSWTNNASTTVARKELQRNMLKKAQDAVESVEFSKRENISLTVSIRKDRLPEFKEKLNQMRDELDAFFQPKGDEEDYDEVYQLSLAFFPLTTESKNKKTKK